MKKDMNGNAVNTGDRICATLECNGKRLASINGSGFDNLQSVKCALLQLAGRYTGIAVLTVRNCTQGWRDVSALAAMRRASVGLTSPAMVTPHTGAQYLIPWAS